MLCCTPMTMGLILTPDDLTPSKPCVHPSLPCVCMPQSLRAGSQQHSQVLVMLGSKPQAHACLSPCNIASGTACQIIHTGSSKICTAQDPIAQHQKLAKLARLAVRRLGLQRSKQTPSQNSALLAKSNAVILRYSFAVAACPAFCAETHTSPC